MSNQKTTGEPITESIITDYFGAKTREKGRHYYRHHHVLSCSTERSNDQIWVKGQIQGQRKTPYKAFFNLNDPNDNACECPLSHHCKHVVALLYDYMNSMKAFNQSTSPQHSTQPSEQQPTTSDTLTIDHQAEQWLHEIKDLMQAYGQAQSRLSKTNTTSAKKPIYEIHYIISKWQDTLELSLYATRIKKNGEYGKSYPFKGTSDDHIKAATRVDLDIFEQIEIMGSGAYMNGMDPSFPLQGQSGSELLKTMLKTSRAYYYNHLNEPIQMGASLPGSLHWLNQPTGKQKITLCSDDEPLTLPFVWLGHDLWYLDTDQGEWGLIDLPYPSNLVKQLIQSPPIEAEQAPQIKQEMEQLNAELALELPLPQTYTSIQLIREKPRPRVYLNRARFTVKTFSMNMSEMFISILADSFKKQFEQVEEFDEPVAEVQFIYQDRSVSFTDEQRVKSVIDQGVLYKIERDLTLEKHYHHQLADYGLNTLTGWFQASIDPPELNYAYLLQTDDPDSNPFRFADRIGPELEAKGWQVIYGPDYPYQVFSETDFEWHNDLADHEQSGWLSLGMGVKLNNGEHIDLIPLIHALAQSYNPKEGLFAQLDDREPVYLNIDNHRYIALEAGRARDLFSGIVELYELASQRDQRLELHESHLAYLSEKLKADQSLNTRWFGSERLKSLAERFKQGFRHEPVDPPATYFKGELRDYQYEGLQWLQFLKNNHLGGVLADDMGLGKTIQILAHITKEKELGHLSSPALIICPTSLLYNWQNEITQFTENLHLLTSYGNKRRQYFSELSTYDVILTTYALMQRDKATLLDHHFHLIILDEAQAIKNNKTKVAQVAFQLNGSQRVCLTGTPLENHLGELWSLFNFLMPGFLGHETRFKQVFRGPIEKHQDLQRQAELKKRIKPFMLRRNKQQVAQELPEKTEMIRQIEMDNKQRDLYETIRISMKQKVQQAIAEKGLNNSQITILDALLKLRQVCCDPRLLPMEQAQSFTKPSPKLDMLRQLTQEITQENRKVVIFSQFAKMLNLIADAFEKDGISYACLTGATQNRAKVIEQFQNGDTMTFLVSLKAGGTGLNLTAADTVIHFDPWWNPSVENQATDRTHRIGQSQHVFVYKLLMKNTVEEKVYDLQKNKAALIQGLLESTGNTNQHLKITESDIDSLFKPI